MKIGCDRCVEGVLCTSIAVRVGESASELCAWTEIIAVITGTDDVIVCAGIRIEP